MSNKEQKMKEEDNNIKHKNNKTELTLILFLATFYIIGMFYLITQILFKKVVGIL